MGFRHSDEGNSFLIGDYTASLLVHDPRVPNFSSHCVEEKLGLTGARIRVVL
jgi:hypothetical protein